MARDVGLWTTPAPVDVVLADDTVVQPDLLVARAEDFTERDLPVAPLLAVEVLSRSTRLVDLNLKRARYEGAGCPSYWVFDPERVELTVWGLGESGYGVPRVVVDGETLHLTAPFGVDATPGELVGRDR